MKPLKSTRNRPASGSSFVGTCWVARLVSRRNYATNATLMPDGGCALSGIVSHVR
ncbi:hypothetical protein KCP75_11985 [Salmonella enterica subsp. enterica]|nr:hypothetical protein KCP75_11985 [Salmonella enterica subsp. enterica]